MTLQFIGTDGSMGLTHGQLYDVDLSTHNGYFWVRWSSHSCPYRNVKLFAENWALPGHGKPCEFCMQTTSKGHEIGKCYPIRPCANGDLGVRAQYLDGGIVLFEDHLFASGYFDINYCPICGRKISKKEG